MARKNLYIISGPNGAGKTTVSMTLLTEVFNCREYVNADAIAAGLSPFNPESMAILAGRLMLARIEDLLARGESFALETTLATRSYNKLVNRAQRQGYNVSLVYFWLESPEVAIQRVALRVSEGGHNIPEDVIRRRSNPFPPALRSRASPLSPRQRAAPTTIPAVTKRLRGTPRHGFCSRSGWCWRTWSSSGNFPRSKAGCPEPPRCR